MKVSEIFMERLKKEDEEKVVGGVGDENTYIGNRAKWKDDENRKKS